MKRRLLMALSVAIAWTGISTAQKPQQQLKCDVLGAVQDSFYAAFKRQDEKVIHLARLADSLFTKSGAQNKECLEATGVLIRKAGSYCLNHEIYNEGMPLITRAIELLEKTDNLREIANGYTTLGIYMNKRNFNEQAIEYLKKGLELRKQTGIEKEIANSYSNIGSVYLDLYDLNKAIGYFQEGKVLADKSGDSYVRGMIYNNLAVCYQRQKQHEKALENYLVTLELSKDIQNAYGTANTLSNIGQVYSDLHEYRKAISYLRAAETMADSAGIIELKQHAYTSMIVCYAGLTKPDSSEYFIEKLAALNDSLNSIEHKKDLIDVEARFNLGQKKEQITSLEEQKALQKKIIYVFIGATLVILVFAFFLIRSFRQIKNKNKIIEEQKHLVEQKQEEILDSIKYAARIQKALITGEKYIERQLRRLRSH
jgi:tetratricopeptide (TPR) repeat protein